MTEPRTLKAELFGRFTRWLLAALVVAGCNHAPPVEKRAKVEGKVAVNGQPVANGFIRFMSLEPNGTNAAAVIKDGHYSLAENEGPTKGKYRVEFNVPSATKKRVPNDDVPGQFREEAIETLPAKYLGDKSTMMRDIDPAQPQVLDFSLTVP
ncbi:MAG TPA: hypothetical protein VGI40_23275 [Pirellulaceae bacterium]|jgi:hypothetical protein